MYTVQNSYKKTSSCNYHGLNFDSAKEGGEYKFLEKLMEQGKIKDLMRLTRIDFYITARMEKDENGRLKNLPPIITACPRLKAGVYLFDNQPHLFTKLLASYKIDMVVEHNSEILDDGIIEFIEVKGKQCMDWRKKWDLLEACFGNDDRYKLTIIK